MKREPEDEDTELRPAPFPAKLVLAAAPFVLFGVFFLLRHLLGSR